MKVRPIHERVWDHVTEAGLLDEEDPDYGRLAEATGWDRQRARRLLQGKTRLLAEDMETLASVLKKSVGALYRDRARAA